MCQGYFEPHWKFVLCVGEGRRSFDKFGVMRIAMEFSICLCVLGAANFCVCVRV